MRHTYRKTINRSLIISLLTLAAILLGSINNNANAAPSKKPNIIFFFTDDQSYDSLGAFGNPDVKTDNIDQLAKQGVIFNRHYNSTSICMASRATVMTGMYEYKTGTNFLHGPMTRKIWQKSYPMLLKDSGYRIGFAGKFGFAVTNAKPGSPEAMAAEKKPLTITNDFDFWAGGPGQTSYKTAQNPSIKKYANKYPHSTLAYGAASADFIKTSVKENKPFALSLFYKAPHRPVQPDPKFNHIYQNTTFRKLPNYGREAGKHFAKQSTLGRQYPRFIEWGYSENETYQQALRKYHQLIYGIDQSIGMVIAALKKQGVADNTVIIFSSDNGYFNGSHGYGSKVLPYEEGSRVPLIIYDPRQKQTNINQTSAITGSVDISATILDIANITIPPNYDGHSLLPIIQSSVKQVREQLPLIQVWGPEQTRSLAVIDQRYKYIYWYYQDAKQGLVPTEELYDLNTDPYELKNLASDKEHANILKTMRQRYDQELKQWLQESVPYHQYSEYGLLFDRHQPWAKKAKQLAKMPEVNY